MLDQLQFLKSSLTSQLRRTEARIGLHPSNLTLELMHVLVLRRFSRLLSGSLSPRGPASQPETQRLKGRSPQSLPIGNGPLRSPHLGLRGWLALLLLTSAVVLGGSFSEAAQAQIPQRPQEAERLITGNDVWSQGGGPAERSRQKASLELETTAAEVFTRAGAALTGVRGSSSSFGDVNGDGALDLVITGRDSNTNSNLTSTLYLGDGQGGFTDAGAGLVGVVDGSSVFGDINSDGALDLVITGTATSGRTATLYLGNGQGGFSPQNAGLTGVSGGSSSLGDVNSDGRLDLVVTGEDASRTRTATLYLGDGTGGFTDAEAGLMGVANGSSALGDTNGDGHLDLVITGSIRSNFSTVQTATLYLGDGNGGFTEVSSGLNGVSGGSSSFGDVNGDGDLDLIITGEDDSFRPVATAYLGDGVGGFIDANAGLAGTVLGSSSLGDANRDGALDLVITGVDASSNFTATLYLGDGSGGFTEADAGLTGVRDSASAFGDVDGDGDNDLIITGADALLSLGAPSARLYVNRTVQELPNRSPVIAASSEDGIVAPGRTITRFVEAGDPDGDRLSLTLTQGQGTSNVSFADVGNGIAEITFAPTRAQAGQNVRFTVTARDGSGLEVTNAPITVTVGDDFAGQNTALSGVQSSSSSFGDVNGDGALDLVITGQDSNFNPTTTLYLGDGQGGFTPQDVGLAGVQFGSSTFGDVNRDGDLDLVLTSFRFPGATLYLGDGRGGFTDAEAGLTGVRDGSSAFGDVNSDGTLDLVLTGVDASSSFTATLYLGDGNGGFTDAEAGLTGVRDGSSAFGDVNSDGALDLVLTGVDGNSNLTATLYLGDGNGGFTDAEAGLTGVRSGSSVFGDVNSDGALDLVLTGVDANNIPIATLYLGDGNGGVASEGAGLKGVGFGSSELGDINGDGALDLVITGIDANLNSTATLYLGDGQGGFTDAEAGLTGGPFGSSALGDVDGDGLLDLVITGDDARNIPTATLYENLTPGDLQTAAATQTVSTGGVVGFGATGVSVDFAGTSGSGDVTVQRFSNGPSNPLGIDEQTVSRYRYVLSAAGDLTFSDDTEVRFGLSTVEGIGAPTTVRIYSRAVPGAGIFTALPTRTGDNDTPEDPSDDVLIAEAGSFSEFAFASDDPSNPLPVQLASFAAAPSGDEVQLRWTTATETNSAGFVVERAVDAGAFQTLRFVASQAENGTSGVPLRYRVADTALPFAADSLTYRLRQTDLDGSTSVSDAVTVRFGAPTAVALQAPFPNPARGLVQLRYELPEAADVEIRVYDVLGRAVATLTSGPKTAGRGQVQMNLSRLAPGTYFLRLIAGGEVRTQRLTVVR